MAIRDTGYEFYSDTYRGSAISESEWAGYAAKATAYLARIETMSRVTPYGDADLMWSMATCAVAEEYHNFDMAANGGAGSSCGPVSSASIGSVSVSYDATFGGAIDLSPSGQATALHDAASRYLHIYMGIG